MLVLTGADLAVWGTEDVAVLAAGLIGGLYFWYFWHFLRMWYWSLPGFGNSYHRSHLKATKLKYSLNIIMSLSWGVDNIETIPDIVSLAAVHWSQATESKPLPYTTACVQFTCVLKTIKIEVEQDWVALTSKPFDFLALVVAASEFSLLFPHGRGYLPEQFRKIRTHY